MINMPQKLLKNNKKGQLVMSIIGGISAIIILTIVCFLIVDTLNGADLLSNTASVAVSNETITGFNVTVGNLLSVSGYSGVACSITLVKNITGPLVATGNWTASNCRIYANVSAPGAYKDVKVDYTYVWNGQSQDSIDGMIGNYTGGINKVAEKIPTVLLVAAVVLLFGAIVFLVQRAKGATETSGGSL